MANPFVHVELDTTDADKAKEFYSRLFAWEFEDMPMGPGGTYTVIKVGMELEADYLKIRSRTVLHSGWRMSWWTTSARQPKKQNHWERQSSRTQSKFRRWAGSVLLPTQLAPHSDFGRLRRTKVIRFDRGVASSLRRSEMFIDENV